MSAISYSHHINILHAPLQSHSCTHTHTLTLSPSHTPTHTLTLTHSHTHTLTHSHPHSQEEDAGSSMSVGSRGLPPLPNHDHYNLIRQRLDRYRRGSEGNFRTPTEIILRRIPQPRLPSNSTLTGQQQHRMDRGSNTSQFRQRGGLNCAADPRNRSISPNEGGGGITGRPRSQSLDAEDTPLSVSHMYNPDEIDSGSST